jgi:hypothetical protein
MSDSPLPPGTSASTLTLSSTSTTASHQVFFYPRSSNRNESPDFSLDLGKNNNQGDGSSSSELEEGEISERDIPPLKIPVPLVPTSSQRYRKPPRPLLRDLPYALPLDIEQSLSHNKFRKTSVQQPFSLLHPHLPHR